MSDIYEVLKNSSIDYERFEHEAVFTCEDAVRLCPDMPGVSLKNLFLRDRNGDRHFLVSLPYDKSADLNQLKDILEVSKLGFASPKRLKKYLGVEPGSVTLLGLINDLDHNVEVVIDKDLWGKSFQCHPLINTATLVIPSDGVENFFLLTGHKYKIVDVPAKVLVR